MRKTKDLTIGATFGAIYGVLLLLIRYFIPATDSLIYYIIPLPLAIYTYQFGYRNGLLLFGVLIALSFLICDPYRTILLLLPNFLIGFLFGVIKNRSQVLSLGLTFLFALLANFLSVYAFEVISGLDYFEYMFSDMDFLQAFFPQINAELFNKILFLVLPIVLIIDALVKSVLLYLLFMIIAKRLKLSLQPLVLKLKFSSFFVLIYGLSFLVSLSYLLTLVNDLKLIPDLLGIIILSIYFIVNFYALYLGLLGLRLKSIVSGKRYLFLQIISIVIFPIGIILGLIYSFLYRNETVNLR